MNTFSVCHYSLAIILSISLPQRIVAQLDMLNCVTLVLSNPYYFEHEQFNYCSHKLFVIIKIKVIYPSHNCILCCHNLVLCVSLFSIG